MREHHPRSARPPRAVMFAFGAMVTCIWLPGGAARAQPVDWVQIKTASFTMYLPKAWKFFGKVSQEKRWERRMKKDAAKWKKRYEAWKKRQATAPKWAGMWRFGSADGKARLFLRIAQAKTTDAAAALKKGLDRMKRFVGNLKLTSEAMVDKVPKYSMEFASGALTGTVRLRDRKTKKRTKAEGNLFRMEQRYGESKIAATLTYLFAGDQRSELMNFVNHHMQHFRVPIAKEAMRMARDMAKARAAEREKKVTAQKKGK